MKLIDEDVLSTAETAAFIVIQIAALVTMPLWFLPYGVWKLHKDKK